MPDPSSRPQHVDAPPSAGATPRRSPASRRWRWIGALLAGVWLVFLVNPLLEGWHRRSSVGGWVGMAATVAFGAAYVLAFNEVRDRRTFQLTVLVPRRRTTQWLGLLLALGIAMTVTLGTSGMACTVYLAVASVMLLPGRSAVVLTLVLAVVGWVVPVWWFGVNDEGSLSVSLLISTFAMWGIKQLMRRNVDLVLAEQENARLAVQDERGRMARDLHDILGHSLTVITVKAELAGRLLDVDQARARAELADLEALSRDALSDVRRAVEGYRELTLPGELARARAALHAAQIRADLPGSTDEVPSDLREVFAWVVREGITNVLRHSSATTCSIRLARDRVEVTDDGVGARAGSGAAGSGLHGLRERAASVGAVLVAGPVEPRGFRLAVVAAAEPAETAEAVVPNESADAAEAVVLDKPAEAVVPHEPGQAVDSAGPGEGSSSSPPAERTHPTRVGEPQRRSGTLAR